MTPDQADSLRSVASQRQLQDFRGGTHYCRVIAVTGGKGGVGKTNVAVNLSLALCEAGARVLLLDADLGLANVDVMLGISPKLTLSNVIRREAELSQIVVEGPLGLKVLPGGTGLPELANLSTLEIVHLLGEMRSLEREHDLLVIDTAAGIGNTVIRFAQVADDVVIVTNSEPTSMLDAYGVMKALHTSRLRGRLHLLVNMVRQHGEDRDTFNTLAAVAKSYMGLELDLIGALPQDDAIAKCIRQQKPYFLKRPQSPAAEQMRLIAARFLSGTLLMAPRQQDSFFARLLATMR